MTDSPRLDYGWVVVAALCVTEVVSWGILYYGFPVLLRPMEADLGWSRVEITGAFSVGMGVAALAALPVGRWIDRHGARALMTAGSCLGTALLLVWSRDKARMTVTLAGALASTIFMPLEAWLVGRLGWRGALVALAVTLAVITIPLHALLLRPAPRRAPPTPGDERREARVPGLTLGASARMAVFWVLAAAFFVGGFTTNTVTVHLIPYLSDRGYSPTVAAVMIGWMGAMQLPARLLFAPIAARFGHRAVTGVIFFAQAASLAQLALAKELPTLVPMVVMLGAANGMATLARATTIAEIFGPRHYGSISGAIALGANGARALAPVGAALLMVALGGYERVFWLLATSLVVAGLGVIVTRPGLATTPE